MFTINYATQNDIPFMMNIIEESLPLLADQDWFVGDTADFYSRHISECGFTLKAVSNSTGTLAAYFTIRYPGTDEDNCGYDLGFATRDLLKTAHMETCVVHPDYRGHHLESRLMSEAITILKQTKYQHLLGTVHPDNVPSVKSFLYNDFHIAKTLINGSAKKHVPGL